MKPWKKWMLAVVVLALPGLAWAADKVVTGGCPVGCPFCP
jgi:hypothetical protein